ncbi:hypothetical protein [Nonomuraea sp. SYSU D8015]|uniref:hypothetical protein n=1 Tax=Nonomuraea sp. SYSU D8015 TaxID=2593644 RepID=UPI00166023CE|nr:hypothetical protein [Nonomuraea sp. SYSU D8015]
MIVLLGWPVVPSGVVSRCGCRGVRGVGDGQGDPLAEDLAGRGERPADAVFDEPGDALSRQLDDHA